MPEDNGVIWVQMQRRSPQAEPEPMNLTLDFDQAEQWIARGYTVREYIYAGEAAPGHKQRNPERPR